MKTSYHRALASLVLAAAALPAAAQDAESQANNPLANTHAFNVQNYYIGELDGTGTDANLLILRYAAPFSIGESQWLMRASLSVNTFTVAPDFAHTTGLGDFGIFAAYLFDTGSPAVSARMPSCDGSRPPHRRPGAGGRALAAATRVVATFIRRARPRWPAASRPGSRRPSRRRPRRWPACAHGSAPRPTARPPCW